MKFWKSLLNKINHREFKVLSKDGAWCWFQDPRSVYVENSIISGWITSEGHLEIGSYHLITQNNVHYRLKDNWEVDDHSTLSILVEKDLRISVYYAKHNKKGIFCSTTVNPMDIKSWNDEIEISDTAKITYSHPFYLTEEQKYYVFWRGETWKPTFSTSEDGSSWADPKILVRDSSREHDSVIRPYLKVTSNGASSLHFAFTDGHPRKEPNNSIYYLKYEKSCFYHADGSQVGTMNALPMSFSKCELVYDAQRWGAKSWIWDIALNESENPVLVYATFPKEDDHRYWYAVYHNNQWEINEITAAGPWFPSTPEGESEREIEYSGGICIDHAQPGIVYLSRKVKGQFELERWETSDMGKTWKSTSITRNSSSLNARPTVPLHLPSTMKCALWMSGHYRHYTDFKTAIKMYLEK
jgi:hypothetical protein